jgi:hypothetical protein
MARFRYSKLFALVALVLVACSGVQASPMSIVVATATIEADVLVASTLAPTLDAMTTLTPATTKVTSSQSPTFTSEAANLDYRKAFSIDYAHPELYLEQGEQSRISDPTVLDELYVEEQGLDHLGEIYRWLKREFTAYSAHGRTIGVVTVDQLLTDHQLGGCHDHGLVYAAVVRELGYPAVMVRTSSIAWVEKFQAGEQGPHIGHVFVEVYLHGKWVLIDSTNGWYVEEGYDPADPVIPLRGPIAGSSEEIYGFYVERKGIDTWGFGIHSPAESTEAMDEFARQLNLESIVYPEYKFQNFAR